MKVFVHSDCPGDLSVTSVSTGEHSTFPPTQFRTRTAGWGPSYEPPKYTTKLHVAFLPNGNYQLVCKDTSGEIVQPKYMHLTFDGKTYQIHNNNNCCAQGWMNMNWDRPPPLCSPYVEQSSFTLPEVSLYQHYEGSEFLPGSHSSPVDGIRREAVGGNARYGPVNFGEPGESRAVLLHWKRLSNEVSVHMKLADGTPIGSVRQEGFAEIAIPPEISGIHEVVFTARRFAGLHRMARIYSFEILPPLPTTSPSMSSAPTVTLVPTISFLSTPNDNKQWFPFSGHSLDNIGQIAFSVKARNDAHIALGSADINPTGRNVPNHLEVFIGGWSNSRSGIRPATGDVNNQVETGGAYLSGSRYNTFRITWTLTDVSLERLAVCDWVTMVSMDRSSLGVTIDRAIIMTGWGSTGEWKLLEGLPASCEA